MLPPGGVLVEFGRAVVGGVEVVVTSNTVVQICIFNRKYIGKHYKQI